MEIIKRGILKSEIKYEIDCRECDTVFRFKKKEATFIPDQRDGDFYKIKCPVCGFNVTIDKCYLPTLVV